MAQSRQTTKGFVLLCLVFAASFLLRGFNVSESSGFDLSLRLVNETGSTFECAGTLWREGGGVRRATEDSTQLCKDGWLSWRDLQPGKYRVMTQAKDMQLFEQVVDLQSESVALGEVALVPGRSISGQILLAGKPIEGALVLVEGGRRTQSDAEGNFFFRGLPVKSLSLRAAAQAGRGALEVPVEVSEGLVVQLERGRGQGLMGLQFDRKEKGPTVTALLEGTPAHALLERGDLLLKVDGVEVYELSNEELVQVLAGEIDSLGKLEIDRAGEIRILELRRIDPVELTQQ